MPQRREPVLRAPAAGVGRIDRYDRGEHAALPQLGQARLLSRLSSPGCVEVPAPPVRVECDVVPHRAGFRLGSNVATAVGEADRARQPVAPMRAVSQMLQRPRQPDLRPAFARMPADRQVAQPGPGLAVGGDKPPVRFPPLAPAHLAEPGLGQVVPDPGQPAATAADAEVTVGEMPFDNSKARSEVLQAPLLLPPLRRGQVATNPATPTARRNLKTLACETRTVRWLTRTAGTGICPVRN